MSSRLSTQHRVMPRTRNRGPCKPCQAAKRKCDQAKPNCSRCRKQNLLCEPSAQARWRVRTVHDSTDHTAASKSPSPSRLCAAAAPSLAVPSAPIESLRYTGSDELPQTSNQPTRSAEAAFFDDEESSVQIQESIECGLGNLVWPRSTRQVLPDPSGLERTTSSMLGDFNTPHNMTPSGTYNDILDWELQSLRVEALDTVASDTDHLLLNSSLWVQDSCISSFHGDQTANHDVLSSMFHDLTDSTSQTEESLPALKPYLSFLWNTFVGQICPFLTPFGNRAENPFLKYLVPNAAKSTSLFVAIIHLARTIVGRRQQEQFEAEARFLEDKAEDVLRQLEEHVSCETTETSLSKSPGESAQGLLMTLSTTLVFCMGFLAGRNVARLASHVKYASILCQTLFKTHADDEKFLYLAKTLGFIQNGLLFTRHSNTIYAPDYLSAALEAQDDALAYRLGDVDMGFRHASICFRDLDMFSGLSASMASMIYTLGRLVKAKNARCLGSQDCHAEFARAFGFDLDGLETRLQRRSALLARHHKEIRRATIDSSLNETSQLSVIARHLDALNEATFWSCWVIYYTDLKGLSIITNPDLSAAVDKILDACAEIPRDSPTAPLMLFPLMIGGMRTTKKVYREFVLGRLECLDNIGLSDTASLCADLVENWWISETAAERPISFSGFVF